jgi:hypothetical protein
VSLALLHLAMAFCSVLGIAVNALIVMYCARTCRYGADIEGSLFDEDTKV